MHQLQRDFKGCCDGAAPAEPLSAAAYVICKRLTVGFTHVNMSFAQIEKQQDNNTCLAYWLSNTVTLLYLLQKNIKPASGGTYTSRLRSAGPAGGRCGLLSSFSTLVIVLCHGTDTVGSGHGMRYPLWRALPAPVSMVRSWHRGFETQHSLIKLSVN